LLSFSMYIILILLFLQKANKVTVFLGSALRPGTTVTVQHEVIHVEAAED